MTRDAYSHDTPRMQETSVDLERRLLEERSRRFRHL
jgi:hypothetical protein